MVTLDNAKKVIAAAEKKVVESGQPMNKEVKGICTNYSKPMIPGRV